MRKFLFCLAAILPATSQNPVQKVVELLTQLKEQVKKDMTADVEMTQAFYEWAEKTEWEKNRDIEDGGRQIESLTAEVEEATGTIGEAQSQIETQSTFIAALEADLKKAVAIREKENSTFKKEEGEMAEAVDTLERAQIVLRSHMSLTSKDSKLRPQLEMLAMSLRKVIRSSWVDGKQKGALEALLQNGENGFDFENPEAQAYESKSGGILKTLANLQDEAEEALNNLRKSEMTEQHNFEMLQQSIEHELVTRKESLEQAQAHKSAAEEQKAAASKNLAITKKTLEEDEAFLAQLKETWANKDSEHKQSQQSFQDELAAIEEAVNILTNEDNAAAFNRQGQSLVQMRSDKRRAFKLTSESLRALGIKFHSSALMQLASLAKMDPFGKVREMISDMIERLENQAVEEAEHKAWCDSETKSNKAKIEDRSAKVSKFSNRVEKLTADIATLNQDVQRLEGEISDIDTSMAKAVQLRRQENEEFQATKADCQKSVAALQQAIQVLRNFYEEGKVPESLLQKPRDFTANAGASTGIIGMLEVAEADFSRLLAESVSNEDAAQTSFQKLKEESQVSRASKEIEAKGKRQQVKVAENSRNDAVSDRDSTQDELDAVLEYQAKVKEQCTYKVPTFEERAARREQEIAGLKNALDILQGEQVASVEPALLQRAQRLRAH